MNNTRMVYEGLQALAHLHTARAALTKKNEVLCSSAELAAEALTLAEKVAAQGLRAVYAKKEVKALPASNGIKMFFHCRRCLESIPRGESPESWARLSVGFTKEGMQVWCSRHSINVAHVHFEGQVHPANLEPVERGKKEGRGKAPKKARSLKVVVRVGDMWLDGYDGEKPEFTGFRGRAWSMLRRDAEYRVVAWKLKDAVLEDA